ncbi:gamma-glutamylputrescine oxidoreductase [Luminiphilus syltensis NOR5-1B]|uniref:Gamma-glutamylputrescine oxidoreductase n=1 Tax=Luminiphilus syltensis NOR5-1B TaxID=565045 RepID=B8KUW3_9GAMM|nr:FAD-binding oxidoreductase [Luminiphilus syltensis]EED36249.1 gamma-glutamylputrescine oxidoreductase [Luminiphilus syltensis NOR5-1B]
MGWHKATGKRHNTLMTTYEQHPDSWYAASTADLSDFPPLSGEVSTDVCVIGGGYTGLSSAIHLRKLGYQVTLLEANRVGWGASGRNGGHVGTGQRAGQDDLEKWVGESAAKDLWQLGLDAVSLVGELIDTHGIDCEWGHGCLHVASRAGHAAELEEEVAHLRDHYGYDQIAYLNKEQVAERTSARGCHGGTLDWGSRHLHPLKYAAGLARVAAELGVKIHEGSRVLGYEEGPLVSIRTDSGSVKAQKMVLGCNGYLGTLEPRIAGNIMPINNFVIATEPLPDAVCERLIKDNTSMSDTLFVINYWKRSADNRIIFGGGETYTKQFPADIKNFVRPYMLKIYPELADTRIDYGWGGTLGITMNRMPDFGRLGHNVFYAHGFSGHGVPTATLAGKLLANAIHGDTTDFDRMAAVPTHRFPGGTLLRWPGLVAGMLFYSLRDKLGV